MELLLIVVSIYFVVGAVKAVNHIASGRVGTEGKVMTFLFVTFAWPFI